MARLTYVFQQLVSAVFVVFAVFAFPALAAGQGQATVAEVLIRKDFGNYAFVRLTSPPTTPAACSTNGGWHFTLPLTTDLEKRQLVLLMTARATGSVVSILGTGLCSEFASVESAMGIGF